MSEEYRNAIRAESARLALSARSLAWFDTGRMVGYQIARGFCDPCRARKAREACPEVHRARFTAGVRAGVARARAKMLGRVLRLAAGRVNG